jgi:uncharacterized membrane protein YeaQ/YmgE (transglycosylase-associated protein family)
MIGALILGVVAGFLGRALMPGRQKMNFLVTILLGLAGAALGWLIFTALLGIGDDDAFDLGGLPGAIVGVLILLFLYERFVDREDRPGREDRPATPAGPPPEGRRESPAGPPPEGRRES